MRLQASLLAFIHIVHAATWCGKAYLAGEPAVPPAPSSRFTVPPLSPTPLISIQCAQAMRPYVSGDVSGAVLVELMTSQRRGELPWDGSTSNWTVHLRVGETVKVSGTIAPGQAIDFSFPLDTLVPQLDPYTVSCTATSPTAPIMLSGSSTLRYLPPNPSGSTVKMDAKNGWIMVPSAQGGWEPMLPIGFYANFDGYLAANLSVLDELKASGVNVLHPVPTFTDQDALSRVLDRMEELGIWLMYDMRNSYLDPVSVEAQIKAVQNRTNLLLWYTADEPDGPGDPLNATVSAYNQIMDLDGYHPISLVLNCEDFEWESYSAGADIILTDPYPLYVNTSYSARYNTVCNTTYGCCGCDNCIGDLSDLATRLDTFQERADLLGRQRNLTTWSVLQAFGSAEFWTGTPTGIQYASQLVLALNHGSTGFVSWVLPTTADILASTSTFTTALPRISPFLFSQTVVTSRPIVNDTTVDITLWNDGDKTLIMASNLNPSPTSVVVQTPFDPSAYEALVTMSGRWSLSDTGVILSFSEEYGVEVGVLLETLPTMAPVGSVEPKTSRGARTLQIPFFGEL